MPQSKLTEFLDCLRKSWAAQAARDLTDRQLLDRFLADREDAAFTVLVQRHGPMVSSVCRRVLGDGDAAEDAFQATFMVLFRRANSIRRGAPLGNWLYGVAQRIAVRARAQDSSRRRHERRLADFPAAEQLDHLTWEELRSVLDEEIGRLPEKCRAPIVLCYFQGKSREVAAEELGWPKGSLNRRLAKAQDLLRGQLLRRGFALLVAGVASALSEKTISAPLSTVVVLNTVKAVMSANAGKAAANAFLSARAIILAEEAMKGTLGLAAKLTLVLLVLTLSLGGALHLIGAPFQGRQDTAKVEAMQQPAQDLSKACIDGLVVDEDGKAVEGAVVSVLPPRFAADRTPVRTAADGSFRLVLEEASARDHVVTASVDAETRLGFYAIHDPVLARVVQARIVMKRSRQLLVHVADAAKKPVEGAVIGVFDQQILLAQAQTNANGLASVRLPSDAKVSQVVGLKPTVGFDYYENYGTWPPGVIEDPPAEVSLTLDGAQSIIVKAVNLDGLGLLGVDLVPWTLQKKGKLSCVCLGSAAALKYVCGRTNAEGLAAFDWIPQDLELGVAFLGHSKEYSMRYPLRVELNQLNNRRPMQLFPNAPLSGKVTFPDGKPAGGILLEVEGRGSGRDFRKLVRTQADGTYSLLVGPNPNQKSIIRRYIVAVTEENWAAPSKTGIVASLAAPPSNVNFILGKGTVIRGTVTVGPNRKPVAKQPIYLTEYGDNKPEREGLVRLAMTDSNGKYAIRVGPGRYKIGGPALGLRDDFTVNAEAGISRDFQLVPMRRPDPIKGVVLIKGVDGKPVQGAIVIGEGDPGISEAVTDDKGEFEMNRRPGSDDAAKGDPKKRKADDDFSRLLDTVIDTRALHQSLSVKEAFNLLDDIMKNGIGPPLPIFIDTEAFKADDASGPGIYDSLVEFPPFPAKMAVTTAIRFILSDVPTKNATFVIYRNYVEVTTLKRLDIEKARHGIAVLYARNPDGTLAGFANTRAEIEDVRILLNPAAIIRGRITDKSGKPLTGISISLTMYTQSKDVRQDRLTPVVLSTQTDDAGRFAISGVVTGSECKLAASSGKSWMALKSLPALKAEPIDLGDLVLTVSGAKLGQ